MTAPVYVELTASASPIHEGDTVLIGVPAGTTPAVAQQIKDQLAGLFPSVSFVMLAGATVEGVFRPDAVEQLAEVVAP